MRVSGKHLVKNSISPGREWQNPQGEIKYFNSIQGWRIDAFDEVPPPPEAPPFETMPETDKESPDDLPF